MMDSLDQPVNGHPDYFVPLSLKLPAVDKQVLEQQVIPFLAKKHQDSTRLWFNSAQSVDYDFAETKNLANQFLKPLGLCADVMGVFVVNANTYDRNIHSDSARLETRLNFYELTQAPGVVRWFPDTGDGYDSYNKNLDGIEFLDYTWPWVDAFKQGHLDWADIPAPVHSTATACASGLVRTNLPHHVIQGSGLRITVTCRVVDLVTLDTKNTWHRIKQYYSSLTQQEQ
jgi:hypothetical protein